MKNIFSVFPDYPGAVCRTAGYIRRFAAPGLLALLCAAPPAQAVRDVLKGTYFETTRLIYPEGAMQGKSIVLNNNSDGEFLLQSYISPRDATTGLPGEPTRDFLVTPPLVRLGAHQTRTLRVLRTGGDFPADRESVFFLTARLIPGEDAPGGKPKAQTGVVMKSVSALSVKVFWRPAGLDKPNAVEDAAGKLKAAVRGDTLTLTNPTPYWVTFRSLTIGGVDMSSAELVHMVPPLGSQQWTVPKGAKRAGGVIPLTWTAIKENGFDTQPFLNPAPVMADAAGQTTP
ncbi:molecular chaperone [Enterobacter ludwigii]|uniref:fimbrial biogenesis chaperone n=1 Tax=Enterobacter ludwigii TaxID=299767 RepID=UPI003BEEB5A3